MSIFTDGQSIKLLADLLNPNKDSSDSEEDNDGSAAVGIQQFGPGDIRPRAKNTIGKKIDNDETKEHLVKLNKLPEQNKPVTYEDWLEETDKWNQDLLETRKRPDYKIAYKQAVTTEDVYLQMGNKTAATASCEEMVIEIKMPEEMAGHDRMELNISEAEIDLKTPVYRLKLPLMHNIDPDKGKATWNTELKVFRLQLVLKRDFDFVNF